MDGPIHPEPSPDPFAPLPRQETGAGAPRAKPAPVPIVPAPEDAPPCDYRNPRLGGDPVARWEYRDADGRLVGHAARFERADGAGRTIKDVVPVTYCEVGGGKRAWRMKGVPAPRPLYRLPQLLAADPSRPVLVVEGEKTAEAAAGLFPAYDVVTSMGGSKAAAQTAWSPLAGREVVICPDNDGPGRSYAEAVARLARAAGAASVAIVQIPDGWPEGWDLADEPPEGADLPGMLTGAAEVLEAGEVGAQADAAPRPPLPVVLATEDEGVAALLRRLGYRVEVRAFDPGAWDLVPDDRGTLLLLPRNDPDAEKQAAEIRTRLNPPEGRPTVGVVLLDGVPFGGTVRDWLDAGHTADELRELLAYARHHEPHQVRLIQAVRELNRRYFVTTQGARATVVGFEPEDRLHRPQIRFHRAADIKLLYQNRHYQAAVHSGGHPIWKDLGTAWLEHKERRTYKDGLVLAPDGAAPPEAYNLWRGFGVEPREGQWPVIGGFLREVVCAGDRAHHAWLLRWMAYCVQRPERQAEVAVVLRGKKGIGKGSFAKVMRRLFSGNALQVANSKHLTGHFNAHLADTLFLFVDEAFWGGDKQAEGVLKALVTEDALVIEPKGLDAFPMPNRLKIVVASNNDWVVSATADERRFLMLDVSEARKGDAAYFAALNEAIEGDDEPAALLHGLLNLDLAGHDHRNPPHTEALAAQKLIGNDGVARYWHDCLLHGCVVGNPEGQNELKGVWPADVVVQVLHQAYLDHAQSRGDRHPMSDARMAERLRELLPEQALRRTRPRKKWNGVDQPARYRLPGLPSCRAAFLAAMRIDPADHPWPEEGEA